MVSSKPPRTPSNFCAPSRESTHALQRLRCFYRAMLSVRGTGHGPVSVCVCLSQVGVLSKRLNESGWFLARELHSTYPTLCYKGIHVLAKIRTLPSGMLLQTRSRLRKFRHGISIVEACYQLSLRKVDAQSVINWAVVGQLSR